MKRSILSAIVISLFAYNSNAQSALSTSNANTTSDFIMQASITGMKTIRSGNVAEKRSRRTELKALGEQLVNDNMEAHKQLMKLARQNGYNFKRPRLHDTEPDSVLIQYRGAEFDKVYIAAMIKQHQKEIAVYENAAQNEPDAKLMLFAQQILLKLKQDMVAVQKMAEEMNVNTTGSLVAANK